MIDAKVLDKVLRKKPVAVFGLARSGLATIRALRQAGVEVLAWDDQSAAREKAQKLGARVEILTEKNLRSCDILVLAPGVPLYYPEPHPVVQAARRTQTEIICDIELLFRLMPRRRTIGITGTNGKSTTTALVNHILKQAGHDAVMGGNIGLPVFDLPLPSPDGVYVFELSSYQLDLCPSFRPDISVLLNITPDHLDRHGTMEKYAAAKERIFEGPGAAVIGVDDEYTRAIHKRALQNGARAITAISIKERDLFETLQAPALRGDHNYQNALAAYAVCRAMQVEHTLIIRGIQSFPGLPHRQFQVSSIHDVLYINDSKATNAESAAKALMSYDSIYWIVGGRAKEGGLSGLEIFKDRIRKAYLIGESAPAFSTWMNQNGIDYDMCGTLEQATHAAHTQAQGDRKAGRTPGVVLLAPACASFDQFTSYEERGDLFARIVLSLNEASSL